MKKWQKEIEGILLDDEEEVLRKLEKTYQQSLKDVQAHAKQLQNDIDKLIADDPDNENQIRAKVYQLQYQQALEKQINGYMDVIKDKNTKDISDYLNIVYSDGFMTQQYALMNQGVNVTMPINQKMLVKSVTYKTEDIPLSTRIYKNVEKAKQTIISEISRGLSTGMSNADISRNLKNAMGVSSRKAWQLAQNEGARVRQDAITDVGNEAKKRGADVVKQWSATLDGKTRPVHAELDEKWAELDEDFEYSGGTVSAPKKFGIASLDINCRCSLLIVPRWDVEGSKSSLRRDNVTKETVRVDNYQDWKSKYYDTVETTSQPRNYTSYYSDTQARKEFRNVNYTDVKQVDNKVSAVLQNLFVGYEPSPLVDGEESQASLKIFENKNKTFKFTTSIVNTAIEAGDSNVDIGNSELANSLHERTHDIVTKLAMRRAGITDADNITAIQYYLFQQEKDKICQDVYIACFTDETFEEIKEIIEKEISERAVYSGGEFISESMVQYLGAEKHSELSENVYNYLMKAWENV